MPYQLDVVEVTLTRLFWTFTVPPLVAHWVAFRVVPRKSSKKIKVLGPSQMAVAPTFP